MEVWKQVDGYPAYEVSNLGNVRSWMKRGARGAMGSTPRIIISLKRSGVMQREIASRYCISEATVSEIVNGKAWTHLTKLGVA